jgi:hydroxyethylthiazole kinase-like uncharacterized protein yjeF
MTSPPTLLTRTELERFPLPPPSTEDKNDKGRMLIVAGCTEVPGAALLCSLAAMRAGAGKLKIVTSTSAAQALGVAMPEARIIAVPEGRDGGFAGSAVERICDLADTVDAVLAGPGMAPGKANARLAARLSASGVPLVLDAEMLRDLPKSRQPVAADDSEPILLPHAGEMAALLGIDEEEVEGDPLTAGRECACRYRAVTLVKGKQSHVVEPEGRAWLFTGGASGLGVSGSGDVLAGVVGGLRARGADALTALLWGVWLHGEAGSALSRKIGKVGFLARELNDEIPALLPS